MWKIDQTRTFMVAKEWISRMIEYLGSEAFSFQDGEGLEAVHMLTLDQLADQYTTTNDEGWDQYYSTFLSMKNYQSPMEEKFSPLIQLRLLENIKVANTDEIQALRNKIRENNITNEYEEYKHSPAPILPTVDDQLCCPKCGAMLATVAKENFKHGHLVLCTSFRDAWIYVRPRPYLPDWILKDD